MIYLVEIVAGKLAGERWWTIKENKKNSLAITESFGLKPDRVFTSIRKNLHPSPLFLFSKDIRAIKKQKEE